MISDYRFMQDTQGQALRNRFSNMLEMAERLEEAWAEKPDAYLDMLFRDLLWLEAFGQTLPALRDCSFGAQIENVRFTLEHIKACMGEARMPAYVRWQLPCFLLELREELYFWAYVHPFPERWHFYYQDEFAKHHQNPAVAANKCKYEVSIFVPAKNKLDYTRRCVESILRETDQSAISYELILINHGSRDETQAYFESIPGVKLLHFKENVRMMMFSSAMRVCEGSYMAFVSNDTVVTKDWLLLLHRCIQSDPRIISATPVTPNVSNFQAVAENYGNMEEMALFAARYNHHDPAEWEQRARVLPVIALYDMQKLNAIGFGDRYFQTMEFWDDDFSLRARRAGYRQILCRNVFCHHVGSVTGSEAQRTENTLEKGRALFIAKHDADPWANGAYYDYQLCTRLQELQLPSDQQANVLGIDAGFGDTLLQIGNILQRHATQAIVDSITTQQQYASDLRAISQTFYLEKHEGDLLESLNRNFMDEAYDYVYLSRPLECYMDWKGLLVGLYKKLKPGGWLLLYLSNAHHSVNVQWFISLSFPPGEERMLYLNPGHVGAFLDRFSETIVTQSKRSWISLSFLAQLSAQVRPRLPDATAEQTLDTIGFYYFVNKKGATEKLTVFDA